MDNSFGRGIGEKKVKLFHKLGLFALSDLPFYFPRAYEDRSVHATIAELASGEGGCVTATVGTPVSEHIMGGGRSLCKTRIFDETGDMELVFFNTPFVRTLLHVGKEYVFYGKPSFNQGRLTFTNPEFEPLTKAGTKTGRILPIYRSTAGLPQQTLRNTVRKALDDLPDVMDDPLPDTLREGYDLMPLRDALVQIHYPDNQERLEAARRRLVFEELLLLQLGLLGRRGALAKIPGERFADAALDEFWAELPFAPTDGQREAVEDIRRDLLSGHGMNRLIQGDVGSGKTVVAAAAAFMALRSGAQTALMVPTEILAEQHMRSLEPLFAAFGGRTALLTGHIGAKAKNAVLKALEDGSVDLVIGTHALISHNVHFRRLSLCITDEQHRFGVAQRARLFEKGTLPHRLVMSATPIPRTLARIIYGDLEVTQMRGMPPGRVPVRSYVVDEGYRRRIEAFVRKTVAAGQQVYIVCPLIEDEQGLGLKAADVYARELRDSVYADLRVGLLHGKIKAAEREKVMRAFKEGETDILVATTVIEVGVDVPNATLMIVENAEHFGLSQLHQLRGRVGRGRLESHCIFFLQTKGAVARQRLDAMRRTNDGFLIAEADLQLRGPGDFFGRRQHGLPAFKLADLSGDMEVLEASQAAAKAIYDADEDLRLPGHQLLKERVQTMMDEMEGGD